MKLSCLPVSLYPDLSSGKMSLADWFQLAAKLGLDGADVSVAHLDTLERGFLNGLRHSAEDAGVEIAMLVSYSDFTHPSTDERVRQVDNLFRQIEAANTLGATFIRVTAGQAHPGVSREDGTEWAIEGLSSCLDQAHQAQVTLAYENHTRGYGWSYNDFSQPAGIFLDIVERLEDSRLRVLFDTANNLAHGDDPVPVLEQVKHRVSVIHLNDIERAGEFTPVLLGTGVAPVEELLHILITTGFDGWVSVEEASNQGLDAFAPAIQTADSAWISAGGIAR